ncbi:hypothetical protein M5K25_009332 [Dendrobium thyrsiflorum]|uniref:CG-1 domain-containing protein n=1 Tax=Dendrobium thyrsiflorum TaxID=117978 RepID=A0ABD0VCG1_DENTH
MMLAGSSFDYDKLHQEAQIRWLKPLEVFFILKNHERYQIEQETPEKPLSGSLFLFNRRVHRFFRKDGHVWRKKRDGRAVGEAHERLKVGNVDALNCYYAHGELNPFFQRRSYWMLDPAYDHIVLVHYREVSEGRNMPQTVSQQPQQQLTYINGSSNVNNIQFQRFPSAVGEIYESYQISGSSVSGEVNSKYVEKNLDADFLNITNSSENSDLSSQSNVNQALRELAEQLSLDKCDNKIFEDLLPAHTNECEKLENPAFLDNEKECPFQNFHENLNPLVDCSTYDQGGNGKQKSQSLVFHHSITRKNSPSWNDMLKLSSSSTGINADLGVSDSVALSLVPEHSCYSSNATVNHQCGGNALKLESDFEQFSSEEDIFGVPFDWLEQFSLRQPDQAVKNAELMSSGSDLSLQLYEANRILLGFDGLESPNSVACLAGVPCTTTDATSSGSNSKLASTPKESSIDWMGTTDLPVEKTAYSFDLLGTWFDQGQHGTVVQKQLFRIHEISPEWSFSFEKTKVFIVGDFLCNPLSYAWAVMFGDVEVPAEIVQQGVLRCQAPEQTTGKVTLCITSRNKESCSEAREFEFRPKPATTSMETLHHENSTRNSEELLLLVKFVRVLLCQHHDLSVSKGAAQTEAKYHRKFKAAEEEWLQIIDQLQACCEISSGITDWVLQELIKDKFQQWYLSKITPNKDGNFLLSKEEQGIIHMISGLGYEWALNPLLDIGVGINFRDANGWTALHWAAHLGREKMAAALLAAGALAGAVTDPRPSDPVGKTAGAIAAASGHKGLAGYLSEADLTSHLSSLTMEACEISKGSAAVEAEKAVESISERTAQLDGDGTEDDLSLKDSLAALRNTAQAAARIQAAFRAHSFRKRNEMAASNFDEYGLTSKDIYGLISSSKNQRATRSYRDQKFDKAALSIQKKYRGWKGRKDFLTFRQHVVKIQAHVRGHQTRKKYRELLWTVGVLEKVVLRWRRKGAGLRGFRPEPILAEKDEEEDIVKVFRKQKVDAALDQACSRVLSMVESPSARQQYRRMLESYHKAKAEQSCAEEAIPQLQDLEFMQDDELQYWFRYYQ